MPDRNDVSRIEQEYRDQGFSVVEGLFSAEECRAVQKIAEKLPNFVSGSLLPVMNPHREQPELLDAMSDERVVSIVRRLMDGNPVGLQTQYFFCQPGTRGFSAHQDNYYVRAPEDKFVSAWLALEDVTAENGALIVLPGSHKEPVLEVRDVPQPSTFGQDPNHNRQECVVETQYPRVSVAVRQGGVVFLHSHVIHSSNDNVTADSFRRVLLMTYLAEGAPFRPGYIAKRQTFRLNARA
jgi:ectoine hydroxylase-related dioxygenase (phytanoyl-CoA dioxygenase family)